MECIFDQLDNTVNTTWGISQFVIINNNWDKVIKIPFEGNYNTNNDSFCCYETNYCDYSLEIYEAAIKAKVSKIFAKMEYLGETKEGKDVYLQERIKSTFGEDFSIHHESEYSLKIVKKKKTSSSTVWKWNEFEEEWLASAIECYGEHFMDTFLDFCYVMGIEDLHDGNYGWRMDGSPVIFDWAGFDW